MKFGKSIVTDSLVLHIDAANKKSYPGSGTAITDLSGNSINGTLTNGPAFNNGNVGHVAFDGVNDYINLGYSSTLNPTSITLSDWVNYDAFVGYGAMITRWSGATTQKSFFLSNYYSTARVDFYIYDTATRNIRSTNSELEIGRWHNVVASYDEVSHEFKIYVDGVSVPATLTTSAPTGPINQSTASTVGIGADITRNVHFTNGNISIAKIYNRALTADEILQNFNATKARFGL